MVADHLKDASYFEACLAETEVTARFVCMTDAIIVDLLECAPETCE